MVLGWYQVMYGIVSCCTCCVTNNYLADPFLLILFLADEKALKFYSFSPDDKALRFHLSDTGSKVPYAVRSVYMLTKSTVVGRRTAHSGVGSDD